MIRIVFLLLVVAAFSTAASPRPNILLVLIDDMGLMDTSVPFLADGGGSPQTHPLNRIYHTPAMEALAADGFRCSRFYANSVCSPTRVSLMTGQSSARHRVTQWISPWKRNSGPHEARDWNWPGLGAGDVTLPRLLSQSGYRTIHCGKGHFSCAGNGEGDPRQIGFDVNIAGGPIGRPSSYYGKDGFGHIKGTSSRHAVPGLEDYRGEEVFLTEALTLEMKREISRAVADDKPFFAYMAHYAVHSPFQADPRFIGRYLAIDGLTKQQAAYASMVEGIDKSLGDLVRHLDDLGVAEDTLVIFLGDNGSDAPMGNQHGHGSSAPLRGKKGTHYEGGMRVPFIAAWAKRADAAGRQRRFAMGKNELQAEGMATIMDIMPTILELAEISCPSGHRLDGGSLWKMMGGNAAAQPQQFLMHFPHKHRSSYFTVWIDRDWKLVLHHLEDGHDRFELFDLANDPYEDRNLATARPDELKRLLAGMKVALKDAGAQMPVGKDGELLQP